MWRVSWHDGFGGTMTADTPDWRVFRHSLGHVDWFAVDGYYVLRNNDEQRGEEDGQQAKAKQVCAA
jgi:hypothetical protein